MEKKAEIMPLITGVAKKNPCRVVRLATLNAYAVACYTYDAAAQSRLGSLELFDSYTANLQT